MQRFAYLTSLMRVCREVESLTRVAPIITESQGPLNSMKKQKFYAITHNRPPAYLGRHVSAEVANQVAYAANPDAKFMGIMDEGAYKAYFADTQKALDEGLADAIFGPDGHPISDESAITAYVSNTGSTIYVETLVDDVENIEQLSGHETRVAMAWKRGSTEPVLFITYRGADMVPFLVYKRIKSGNTSSYADNILLRAIDFEFAVSGLLTYWDNLSDKEL